MSRPVPSTRALRTLRAQLGLETYTCTSCQQHNATATPKTRRLVATQARPRQRQQHVSTSSPWPASSAHRPLRSQPRVVLLHDSLKEQQQQQQQRRNVTYVAPVTSVNAARNVPDANRELHTALSALESVAAEYVNLSQLALALRGLEARDPITRVAVQASTSLDDALRLVRLVLIDPTRGIEESWETELLQKLGEEKTLLIRHGPEFDIDSTNPLVEVVSVPAPALENNRLELLVVRRNGSGAGAEDDDQASSLVLTIETPISATGRYSQVTYPVHKSLFFGKGIEGLLGARYEEVDPENRWNVSRYAVVDVGEPSPQQPPPSKGLSLVSISQAENAIKALRQGGSSTTEGQKTWPGSHVADVSKFIFTGTESTSGLKPLHRAYISHILTAASTQLASEQTAVELSLPSIEEIEASVTPLRAALTTWSESAHTELRNELANAFASRSWDKLAWWKLPFRVDDVGMIGSDILGRFYLADAEKGIIWVGGRLEQAGLTNSTAAAKESAIVEGAKAKASGDDNSSNSSNSSRGTRDVPDTYFRAAAPWPQQIALSRGLLLARSLPALQARAQALLLEALSGTSLSAAVAALAYAMVSTTGVYEAGSVFALGTVVALRRLQRLWEKARDAFVQDVHNEGRAVLEEVERECVDVIDQSIDVKEPEGQETRNDAARAIENAREALDRLK